MNVLHEVPENLSPRRRRSREKRTERIIETALQILADDGFSALTMGRLASELDVSTGSLYRYFASKDALVVTLQARAIARIHQLIAEAREAWQPSLPKDGRTAALCEVFGVAACYQQLPAREPRFFRLVSEMLGDPRQLVATGEITKTAAEPFAALLIDASGLFAAAAEQGAIDGGDPLERTVLFWTALHGVLAVDKLDRHMPADQQVDVFKSERLALSLTATLLRGWGAKEKHVEAALGWLDSQRTPPRHSRESENPGKSPMDPRFRGDDEVQRGKS